VCQFIGSASLQRTVRPGGRAAQELKTGGLRKLEHCVMSLFLCERIAKIPQRRFGKRDNTRGASDPLAPGSSGESSSAILIIGDGMVEQQITIPRGASR